MLLKIIKSPTNFKSFYSGKTAIFKNVGYRNTIFSNLKLGHILTNDLGLEDGYDFKLSKISFPTWIDIGYESIFTGQTKPFETNVAIYDPKLHLSHKKYIENEIYNLGKIGKAGVWGNGIEFCDFVNCQIESTNFENIIMSNILTDGTIFSDNIYNKVSFEYCHFKNTRFNEKTMIDVEFRNCHLKNVKFENLSMDKFLFYDCKIDNITFDNIPIMSNGSFQCSTIDHINMINVNLNHVNISHCRVENININNVNRKTSEFGFVYSNLIYLVSGKFDKK